MMHHRFIPLIFFSVKCPLGGVFPVVGKLLPYAFSAVFEHLEEEYIEQQNDSR
jgi:hypothetical protein